MVWPLRLTWQDLVELFVALRLEVRATSPIARLRHEVAEAVSLGVDRTPPSPAVTRALRVLAAPRQLLLLYLRSQQEPHVLGFLNDGELVVRFDVGATGCTIAEPCEHERFAQLVSALADVEQQNSTDDDVFMSQKFLEMILAFRAAGLWGDRDTPISLAEAEAVITSAGNDAACVSGRLRALEADGVLTIEHSTVLANPRWRDRYPFLCVPASVKIEAFELSDLAEGRKHRKLLAVLGRRAERVIVLPASVDEQGRDVILQFPPATRSAVGGAVERLLAPPLTPPCSPVTEGYSFPQEWLDAPRSDIMPGWHLQALEEIVAPLDDVAAIPSALLAPQAVIEVLSGSRGGAGFERTVVALGAKQVIEWTLDGSLIRWRALGPGHIAPRIDELIPITGHTEAGATMSALPTAALKRLLTGPVHAQATLLLPSRLRALADDDEMRWYRVRTTRCVHGVNEEHCMLLADSPAGGSWRFDLDGRALTARPVDSVEIYSALVSALTEPTTTVASVDNGARIS